MGNRGRQVPQKKYSVVFPENQSRNIGRGNFKMKRNGKNKVLALLMAIVMLLSVLPMSGMAGADQLPQIQCSCSQDCRADVHMEGCPMYGQQQEEESGKALEKLSSGPNPQETQRCV